MKQSRLILTVLLLLCLLLLCSCGNDDAPTGFILASEPDTDGFYLYVPEEWSVQRTSGVVTAYLSNLSTTNVTAAYVKPDETDMSLYWSASEEELREDFPDYCLGEGSPVIMTVGEYPAYFYEYEGTYAGVRYGFRQYFILTGETPADGMYVLTYTASKDANPNTGTVDYDATVSYLDGIISNFRLKSGSPREKTDLFFAEGEAPAGMKQANRFTRFGLDFYVPQNWLVDLSDGFISAVAEDGASVGIHAMEYDAAVKNLDHYGTGVGENGFTQVDYWNLLQAEYGDYLTDFTVEEEPVWEGEDATQPSVTGEVSYRRFTFTGSHAGESYRVTLYLLWETGNGRDLYLLTYTATPATYDAHLEEVEQMLREIRF